MGVFWVMMFVMCLVCLFVSYVLCDFVFAFFCLCVVLGLFSGLSRRCVFILFFWVSFIFV